MIATTAQPSYYEILGVPMQASDEQIRLAYEHRVAHIEADSPSAADGLRAQLLEAMEILTDPDLRKEYDRLQSAPGEPAAEAAAVPAPAAEPAPASIAAAVTPSAERFDFEAALDSRKAPADNAGEPVQLALDGLGAPPNASLPATPTGGPPVIARISNELVEAQRRAEEQAIANAEAALARVAARVRETRPEQPRPKPVELGPDSIFSGELLRKVRESKRVSLQRLAEQTRISLRHLENIEADRYAELPATVYLRGILMNLARELALDPLRVARTYLQLVADSGAGKRSH